MTNLTDRNQQELPAAGKRPIRWRPAAIIVAVAAIGDLAIWHWAEFFPPPPFLYGVVLTGIALICLLAWFVFYSHAGRGVQLCTIGLLAAAMLLPMAFVRVRGVLGNIRPIFAWRFGGDDDPAVNIEGAPAADLTTTSPHDSPAFMGAKRTPVVEGVRLARQWKTRPPKLLWRQPIGEGFSAFAVMGSYAVTQQQQGEDELVVCYHWPTGKAVWKHAYPARFASTLGGTGPRATPTIDEGRVYTLGATGILNCLDGGSGRCTWSRNVVEEAQAEMPEWGKSCSPLIVDDLVVVSAGGAMDNSLVAYHKHTGRLVWQAGSDASSYSSPALAVIDGVRQILMVNWESVAAHDPADGRILWQQERLGPINIAQPVVLPGDHVFHSTGYGRGSVLWHVVRDRQGQWTVDEVWRDRTLMKTKLTNIVLRDGYAYGISAGLLLECIDPLRGERQWRHRGGFGHGQVLLVDDLLLVQTESGEIVLAEANPQEYVELGRFAALTGRTWNYPVLVGRHLLVRNDTEAACYELPLAAAGE